MDNLGSDYNADKSWPTAITTSNECYVISGVGVDTYEYSKYNIYC